MDEHNDAIYAQVLMHRRLGNVCSVAISARRWCGLVKQNIGSTDGLLQIMTCGTGNILMPTL